jgi:ribonuclease HI
MRQKRGEDVMEKNEPLKSFYVAPAPEHIRWAESEEGREALRRADERAEAAVREQEKAHTLTPEILNEPFTI